MDFLVRNAIGVAPRRNRRVSVTGALDDQGMSVVAVANTIHTISRLIAPSHRVRRLATCPSGLLCNVRTSFFCQSKTLSAAMSTRVRSPTIDLEVPAPVEKKIRLEENLMDESNVTKEDTSIPVVSGPSKKVSKSAKRKQKRILPEPYSSEDVLWRDIVALLGDDTVDHALQQGTEWDSPFDFREEVEVEVSTLSSNGADKDVPRLSIDFD